MYIRHIWINLVRVRVHIQILSNLTVMSLVPLLAKTLTRFALPEDTIPIEQITDSIVKGLVPPIKQSKLHLCMQEVTLYASRQSVTSTQLRGPHGYDFCAVGKRGEKWEILVLLTILAFI